MVFGRLDPIAQEIARMNREEMIRTGTEILYAPKHRCSCLGKHKGTNIVCRVCDGFGWFWIDSEEIEMRAIIQNATLHRELVNQGFVQSGDLVCQFDRRPLGIAENDRVRLNPQLLYTFGITGESAVVERGTGAADRLDHRIFRVMSIVRADPVTGQVTLYSEDDYSYTPNTNVLTWSSAMGAVVPLEGQQYAISYLPDYDWIVTQPPGITHVGAVGIEGKILLSRRKKSQRDKDESELDAFPTGSL